MQILALCGSLRAASYNQALIEAMVQLSPAGIEVRDFSEMAALPLFNPDIEPESLPAVMALRCAVGEADGLLIASPEYAHGISSVIKTALDWLVGGEEFISMPVAVLNTSPRASHAQAQLREILSTMSARIIEPASISLRLLSTDYGANEILQDETMVADIRMALLKFAELMKQA